MNLLEEYKQANRECSRLEKDFQDKLRPCKERVNKLQDKLEVTILKDNIYVPYKEMVKWTGYITEVSMVVQYGKGYQKIEKLRFNGFSLKDGKLIDSSMYPPRFRWVRDNVYENWSLGEKSTHDEIIVLGCYNLELDGVPIFDSQLEVLWKEK